MGFIIASTNLLYSQSDITINDADHTAYDLELIYDQVKIPWSIEFIDENTIVFSEKEGKIFILNNGKLRSVWCSKSIFKRSRRLT